MGGLAQAQAEPTGIGSWLRDISAYDREFKRWISRSEKIIKRYTDEGRRDTDDSAKFNILWSNVQTLVPAVYSRIPQPDVARRFRDNDPVGRVASLILERALEFEITHYSDYRSTLGSAILDRFLPGRGQAWVRYEPHFRSRQQDLPIDGSEISEDVDLSNEELDYEKATVDYVHWKDFGHSVARTWEEVTRVWRRVYMLMPAKVERFGEKLAKTIPLDAKPKDARTPDGHDSGSWIYEGWDKDSREAVWFHKGMNAFLDTREDPLGLEGFWPCPKPLYATITNESLVPTPDFIFYQDQARALDVLADRIDGLIHALQVKGVYNAAFKSLARLFSEGANTELIPVEEWTAFAEKNGLRGAIDLVDLAPIVAALQAAYEAAEALKQEIYELTGIADILRAKTSPVETLGAQRLKGQFASLRLSPMQAEVARFATEILQLQAQVMCKKFSPQTLLSISAAKQLSQVDQQMIEPAIAMLLGPRAVNPDATDGPNPTRDFRIEVAADTLVEIDEEADKASRMEFLKAIGGFLGQAEAVGSSAPQLIPLMMELLKFAVTGFKVGKTIEGTFDEALDQLRGLANQPKPNPELLKIQQQHITDQGKLQLETTKMQMEMQLQQQKQQMEAAVQQHLNQMEAQRDALKSKNDAFLQQQKMEYDRWNAQLQAATKVAVAEIMANSAMDRAQLTASTAEAESIPEQ